MATSMIYLIVTILLVAADTAFAESNMLQDFCVADLKGITSLFICSSNIYILEKK